MPHSRSRVPLFARLRGATALRVLAVCAAILASQNSLACALEEAFNAATVELTADSPRDANTPVDGGCCALCTDCAHSGACCTFASIPRGGGFGLARASLSDAIGPPTSAPTSWTPPTLLRPPISAA